MLRDLFVLMVLVVGVAACLRGPFYALLLYLWVAYFRPEQWVWSTWVENAHLSFVTGTVLVCLTILTLRSEQLRWSIDVTLLALFFVQSLVSVVFSQSLDWSWGWWTDFAKVMLVGYFIVMHVDTPRRLRLLMMVVALSLGFEAVKQGWVQLILNPGATNANQHPVLGDNNGVAVGMFMLAPILGALASTARRRGEKWFWWFCAVGTVVRGVTTYSRGGLLAACALGATYLWGGRRRVSTFVVTFLVVAIIFTVMPRRFWDRMETIDAPEEVQDESSLGRLHFWRVAVRMATDHPLVGVGFNGFSRSYDKYDFAEGAFGRARAVHSTWFGTLAELGFPGLLLLSAILLRAFWNCRCARSTLRGVSGCDGEVVVDSAHALQSAFVVYAIGGSFINAHYSEMFWHFVWISIVLKTVTETCTRVALEQARGACAVVSVETSAPAFIAGR